ncbi:hypothetical protein G5I_01874 [Acromyrmex echinatior]|uniref:Uncharacterized protein n=1 Tax=Acromyrmex echinatior TaxID=103372 RepID=F4W8T7_ACREC|nr:hypothetical protein G5I_01874 [Acromyrmex echinatior]
MTLVMSTLATLTPFLQDIPNISLFPSKAVDLANLATMDKLYNILTGAVINSNHIKPQRFLEDAGDVVLERVRDAVERHDSVKVNIAFNGEFATKDKRANKSIITKNSEIYRCTDMHEWYERHVVEPILAPLEEFQERDSG